MIAAPTSVPTRNARKHRGDDGAAEEEAQDGGELDVAHPHPARVREGDQQEGAARGGSRDQVLGDGVGRVKATIAGARTAPSSVSLLGMIR